MIYYSGNHNPDNLTIKGCKKNNKNICVTYNKPDSVFIGDYFVKVKDNRGCCMFTRDAYDFMIGANITIIHE